MNGLGKLQRLCCAAGALIALSAAVPSSASANAANCRPNAANVEECRVLATCFLIGAATFNHSTAQEAVAWTGRCLATHRSYKYVHRSTTRAYAVKRGRRMRAWKSTFLSLHCEAIRRAGQRPPRVCRSRTGRTGGRGGGGTRTPSYTG